MTIPVSHNQQRGSFDVMRSTQVERNNLEAARRIYQIFLEKNSFDACAPLRWPNTVCARFTDSVSDAIKRALGLWYANTAVDEVIPHHMKWVIKLSFDPK